MHFYLQFKIRTFSFYTVLKIKLLSFFRITFYSINNKPQNEISKYLLLFCFNLQMYLRFIVLIREKLGFTVELSLVDSFGKRFRLTNIFTIYGREYGRSRGLRCRSLRDP